MQKYGKLYPVSFGFAFGIISGIGWMLLCWAGARWGWGMPAIKMLGSIYYNVGPSFVGGLWALFEGFIDSFVFGLLVALVYNYACVSFCPKGECDSECSK